MGVIRDLVRRVKAENERTTFQFRHAYGWADLDSHREFA